jgi:hypothetical protein
MERITQIQLINDTWKTIDFSELKHGDKFRLFDLGRAVIDEKGETFWFAIGAPFKNKDGILTINAINQNQ